MQNAVKGMRQSRRRLSKSAACRVQNRVEYDQSGGECCDDVRDRQSSESDEKRPTSVFDRKCR